ncbi:MAG: phenol hydroxylase subunit P4 [Betaproteobacteria bacterium]|nr:phenol hydroxylase subunit P4 [Betaproteobacteria bacterium]
MPVAALKEYIGVPRDSVDKFLGQQLVYVSRDHHLLFASAFLTCVPPQMKFREFVEGPLKTLIQPDPDAEKVDWTKVQWLKSNQPWQPQFNLSLKENGIEHKDQIRFQTPGLNTLSAA